MMYHKTWIGAHHNPPSPSRGCPCSPVGMLWSDCQRHLPDGTCPDHLWERLHTKQADNSKSGSRRLQKPLHMQIVSGAM